MAGLGEVCTDVAAIQHRGSYKSFHMHIAAALMGDPFFQKDIPYLPEKNIDFTSAKRKRKKNRMRVGPPLHWHVNVLPHQVLGRQRLLIHVN